MAERGGLLLGRFDGVVFHGFSLFCTGIRLWSERVRSGPPLHHITRRGLLFTELRESSGFNIIDLEAVSDSGLASGSTYTGKWRVDLGKPTTDGLHGTAVMHQAIAASIRYSDIKF